MPPPGAGCTSEVRLSLKESDACQRKGVTKCQELRVAESPRKVFREDGILNRTPEDQTSFPGRDRASSRCRGNGHSETQRPETWFHGDEFCVPGGGRWKLKRVGARKRLASHC